MGNGGIELSTVKDISGKFGVFPDSHWICWMLGVRIGRTLSGSSKTLHPSGHTKDTVFTVLNIFGEPTVVTWRLP